MHTDASTLQFNGTGVSALRHPHPDIAGKTAAEYVADAVSMQQAQYSGKPPPAIVKWMGDAALAVLPTNRMWCAIGLTSGLMIGGNLASIATGKTLLGKEVEADKVLPFLKKLHKVIPYDALPSTRNNWLKYAQWGVYSLGGFIGIKWGTGHAYRNVHKRNRDPHHLEDYLSRVSMHQGDTWSWLAASGGIFGSAAGLFLVPVPGINYALGLAARTTSMQDRNIMIKGLNETISGAKTTSYLRLKEGLHYMCHYLVGNKAENPTQIEYLAYTLLGPVFKDQLQPHHIQEFADAVHAVRDHYWQPGGIPPEKRAEAVQTMKEVFTGAGLEVLLINMGLNPGTVKFNTLNGLIGKIGNTGAHNKVAQEEKNYHAALRGRIATYVKQGLISETRAQWVEAGIEAAKQGKPLPPEPLNGSHLPIDQVMDAPAITGSDGIPLKDKAFPADSKVDMGAKVVENPIKSLIRTAQKDQADWRETVLHRKQDTAAPTRIE